MSVRNWIKVLAMGGLGVAAVGVLSMVACPLSHDEYETDRPCWFDTDCVADEMCSRADACTLQPSSLCCDNPPCQNTVPENVAGQCAKETAGPCGLLDAGIEGYYCFPTSAGEDQDCYYDPQSECTECEIDGGVPRDCPAASCLAWKGRYGCRVP